jgi:hypothetical protein
MSVAGIASNIPTALSGSGKQQNNFQQIQSEFQQLGTDLQSGNLGQAQSDFATLSQNLPGLSQNAAATTAAPAESLTQAFTQLGQDLQSGNLSGAQADYATIQQDTQQNLSQYVGGHHHHHHAESNPNSSSSSQQTNAIDQAFGQLAQSLQAGNLQGAQSAFSTLQNDLQQIGGFVTSGTSGAGAPAATGSLNVTA